MSSIKILKLKTLRLTICLEGRFPFFYLTSCHTTSTFRGIFRPPNCHSSPLSLSPQIFEFREAHKRRTCAELKTKQFLNGRGLTFQSLINCFNKFWYFRTMAYGFRCIYCPKWGGKCVAVSELAADHTLSPLALIETVIILPWGSH